MKMNGIALSPNLNKYTHHLQLVLCLRLWDLFTWYKSSLVGLFVPVISVFPIILNIVGAQ